MAKKGKKKRGGGGERGQEGTIQDGKWGEKGGKGKGTLVAAIKKTQATLAVGIRVKR
jgi:hypothetical protein